MRVAVFTVLGLTLAPALWADTPRIADPGYLARPLQNQAEPPTWPLDPIVAPVPGVPALVGWGETLQVTVLLPPGAKPGRPEDWVMALTSRTRGPGGEMVGSPVTMRFVLEVKGVKPGPEGTAVVSARIPADPPRDTYHLELAGPGGVQGRRVYAVRVLGAADPNRNYDFVLIGDHQLKDPSTHFSGADRNNQSYPKRGENDAESMFIQQVSELSFLDPDFILYVGDLVFGVDFRDEFLSTLSLWWQKPLATYLVPGNHDAMALYELALKEGWWIEAIKSVRCAEPLLDGEVTADKVFELLICMLGDLKKILFEDLSQDGLDYWHRLLGPGDYSFDLGAIHFVGINTFAGTPERRHAFVLGLGFIGIDLDAATVDNYGGTLTPEQLKWLGQDLKQASQRKQTIVLFLHHDPRGNADQAWGRRYHENQPFPTEPLGLRAFQEWNYEGEWDSNPKDTRGQESQTNNSAVALLKLIAKHVHYVFNGHLHDDRDELIKSGTEIAVGSGIRVAHDVQFVRVTTASSTPENDDSYWGYRRMHTAGKLLTGITFDPARKWKSLPSGNFWIIGAGIRGPAYGSKGADPLLYMLHSGLAVPLKGVLRAYLEDVPQGYRFPATGGKVKLIDVGRAQNHMNVYYLQVEIPPVPGSKLPVPEGQEQKVPVTVKKAQGNQTPLVSFGTPEDDPVPNQPVLFDGSVSKDPEGQPLIQYLWHFGDGHSARGEKVTHTFEKVGNFQVSLTAFDDCGAYARYTTTIPVSAAPSCSFTGPACVASSASLVFFGLVFVVWLWRRRIGRKDGK